ncbi:Ribosomal large subunit pseudouridine synthase A [Novipirellula aureliae]|uniref:Ribosomal large subunit pseudouridine synthase A n=1 Tax=Novipirellula aureliae TaxID=2527966 RepID=A0A5C6DY71_9BACT|nr:RluA family pseudouridine synthase [Novipirellula aureliae]TWU40351.1 Ribosomal large subunit pseudouridine synthase A [Novipirellula aureliae]
MRKPVCSFSFDPLPGSIPYESRRSIRVKAKFAGLTFIDFLCRYHPPIARQTWLDWIDAGDIRIDSFPVRATRVVREGDCFVHVMHDVTEPEVNGNVSVIHQDKSMLVIDKPAPLPMHASGRFSRNTLLYLLQQHYSQERLRIAHRLDANTTGVVVVCRSGEAAAFVQPQFERREVEKLYLVRATGSIAWNHYRCDLAISSSPAVGGRRRGAGGRTAIDASADAGSLPGQVLGLPARTDFEVVKRLPDNTTLLLARPLTGRTNQIRVHLWSLGFPVFGDPLYLTENKLGEQQTLTPDAQPLCLHAHRLTFCDPTSKTRKTFESEPPPWWIDGVRSHLSLGTSI